VSSISGSAFDTSSPEVDETPTRPDRTLRSSAHGPTSYATPQPGGTRNDLFSPAPQPDRSVRTERAIKALTDRIRIVSGELAVINSRIGQIMDKLGIYEE